MTWIAEYFCARWKIHSSLLLLFLLLSLFIWNKKTIYERFSGGFCRSQPTDINAENSSNKDNGPKFSWSSHNSVWIGWFGAYQQLLSPAMITNVCNPSNCHICFNNRIWFSFFWISCWHLVTAISNSKRKCVFCEATMNHCVYFMKFCSVLHMRKPCRSCVNRHIVCTSPKNTKNGFWLL